MKGALMLVGGVLIVTGFVWLLQGINLLPGSFMTGQAFWAWAGLVSVIVGLVLLLAGLSRRARS